jgi:hypothetical protein
MYYSEQEQFQKIFKQEQEKFSKYDENSIDKAREKWLDARDLVDHIKGGGNSLIDIYVAHQRESEAKTELDNAVKYSSHLQQAKRERERLAKLEAEKTKELQENAVAEKAAFRKDARARWMAVGGTEHSFNENFESLWVDELKKRTTEHRTTQEQMMHDMLKSGKYYV